MSTSSLSYQRLAPGVLFDGNKELVVTRGNGCPITHLKVFRAPICKPRRGYPEYIDLVTPTNAGSIERLFGLWKTKPQDRKKSRPNSKSASSGASTLGAAKAAGLDAATLATIQSMAGEIQAMPTQKAAGFMEKDRSEIRFTQTSRELAPVTVVSGKFRPEPGSGNRTRKVSGYLIRSVDGASAVLFDAFILLGPSAWSI